MTINYSMNALPYNNEEASNCFTIQMNDTISVCMFIYLAPGMYFIFLRLIPRSGVVEWKGMLLFMTFNVCCKINFQKTIPMY